MVELDPALIDELERLAPAEEAAGSWREVVRRAGLRPRRRRAALRLAAAAATLVALGTAANAAFGWKVSPFWLWVSTYPPGRTGPIVTVFSGPDWNLVAWKSTKGVCTSYGAPGVGGSGCRRLPKVPIALEEVAGVDRSSSRIIGNVSAEVTRVLVRDSHGRSFRARLSRRLPELRTRRRFFLGDVPEPFAFDARTDRFPQFTLLAYDARGRVIGRAR